VPACSRGGQDSLRRAIFLSYRRDDAEGESRRLYDDLVLAYGPGSVLLDVAASAGRRDFREAIDENLAACGALLAVIGPAWATSAGASGQRRLDNAEDFVRLEISSALARNIAVIPVLVREASIPLPDELPDNMKDFGRLDGVEISRARWTSDVAWLVQALKPYVIAAAGPDSGSAAVALQQPSGAKSKRPSKRMWIAGGIAALLVLGAAGYSIAHKTPPDQAATPDPAVTTPEVELQNAVQLSGAWRNTNSQPGVDALRELRITGNAPHFTAEALGGCAQGECSWGVEKVLFGGDDGVVTFSPRNTPQEARTRRNVLMTVRRAGDKLDVEVMNTWWTEDGKAQQNEDKFQFERER
jgi:hypothetical protein